MSATEHKTLQLQKRLTAFSSSVVGVAAELPATTQARHIATQVLRCGTSVAANYAEARGAESRTDFIHKLRLVLKELNETEVWLDLIVISALLPAAKIDPVMTENRELCRIIAKSIQTAGGFRR